MSLPPDSLDPIPAETARIAHAAFPHGCLAMRLREVLGTIYHDGMFADLYPAEGTHALPPWRLALITLLQYAETLSDRQAAHAVRGRIDWKYALALPLEDPGFDASALSTFRERLVANQAEERLVWAIVDACSERGLLRKRGRQRTDATHVLASVRSLNRLELVGETLRVALEALAVAAPAWLAAQVPSAWATRYGRRIEESRLPEGEGARQAWATETGQDGVRLLMWVTQAAAPAWLRELPAVQVLRQVWEQQYVLRGEQVRWRTQAELPPGEERIQSPFDLESRWGMKRGQGWLGSKVHLTERCDQDLPHLITQVTTTPASVPDQTIIEGVWDDLAARDLLPGEQYADAGYVDAHALVAAQTQGIDLIGPVQPDSSWQAREGAGYAAADFTVDWGREAVRCPAGRHRRIWAPTTNGRGEAVIRVRFAREDCQACPVREACTSSTINGRSITLLPSRELHEARRAAQARQATEAFKEQYRRRAGIEGTISHGVRQTGMRRTRYRTQAKTHLEHCAQAAAINAMRVVDFLAERPRAVTRRSHLCRVLQPAA
jgi:transposase